MIISEAPQKKTKDETKEHGRPLIINRDIPNHFRENFPLQMKD